MVLCNLCQESANTFWHDPKKIALNPHDPKKLEASFLFIIIFLVITNFKATVKRSNFYKQEKVSTVLKNDHCIFSSSEKYDLCA